MQIAFMMRLVEKSFFDLQQNPFAYHESFCGREIRPVVPNIVGDSQE